MSSPSRESFCLVVGFFHIGMRCVRTESATASSACATRIPHVAKRCVINLGVFKLSELVFDK